MSEIEDPGPPAPVEPRRIKVIGFGSFGRSAIRQIPFRWGDAVEFFDVDGELMSPTHSDGTSIGALNDSTYSLASRRVKSTDAVAHTYETQGDRRDDIEAMLKGSSPAILVTELRPNSGMIALHPVAAIAKEYAGTTVAIISSTCTLADLVASAAEMNSLRQLAGYLDALILLTSDSREEVIYLNDERMMRVWQPVHAATQVTETILDTLCELGLGGFHDEEFHALMRRAGTMVVKMSTANSDSRAELVTHEVIKSLAHLNGRMVKLFDVHGGSDVSYGDIKIIGETLHAAQHLDGPRLWNGIGDNRSDGSIRLTIVATVSILE